MGNNNGYPSKKMVNDNGHPSEEMSNNNGHPSKEMGNDNGHPSEEMSNNNGNPPLKKLNIKLFGDAWTGKTCLSEVYLNGVYKEYTGVTLGFDFTTKELTMHNIATKVFIWDHPGRKRLRFLISKSIPGADGIFLLYDVTNIQTFLNLPEWLKTVRSLNPGAIIFIIGAKCDLFDKKEVSRETGLKFASLENLEFFECSAKTGENVNYVFEHMVLRLLQKKEVLPFDQIEGKSHELQETKEKLNSAVSEKEILKIGQKIIPVEDTPKFLKEGTFSSEMEIDCLGLKKDEGTDMTKKYDNISPQSNKDTSSELNEGCNSLDNPKIVLPETKKLALSDEKMQLEGKCPTWFA